jgi:hypothetical protein
MPILNNRVSNVQSGHLNICNGKNFKIGTCRIFEYGMNVSFALVKLNVHFVTQFWVSDPDPMSRVPVCADLNCSVVLLSFAQIILYVCPLKL